MAKKTKKKYVSRRMSVSDRITNSAISTARGILQGAGYDVFKVKANGLIRMYAEFKKLTIPEGKNLKRWIVYQIKGPNPTLKGKAPKPSKKKQRRLKPTLETVADRFAQENRRKMTPAAKRFRTLIGNAQINVQTEYMVKNDHSFYLVDFYIPSANLCVEIDGGYHNTPEQKAYDQERDAFLISKGYRVVRIPNEQMMKLNTIELREILGI